jgi:hypothetical protein
LTNLTIPYHKLYDFLKNRNYSALYEMISIRSQYSSLSCLISEFEGFLAKSTNLDELSSILKSIKRPDKGWPIPVIILMASLA